MLSNEDSFARVDAENRRLKKELEGRYRLIEKNIRLKNEIKEKDDEIQDLRSKIEELESQLESC